MLQTLLAALLSRAAPVFVPVVPIVLGVPVLIAALSSAGAAVAEEVTGEAIYKYCQSCHGKRGEGGENGKYPRIAGLPRGYVDTQLHAFKSQQRVNKPMIPIFKHHRFDAEVIAVVSAHLAGLPRPGLSLWPYEADPDALAAFASREDYMAAGAKAYADRCAGCHGTAGNGDVDAGAPPLIDQYPAYLRKQIADFGDGRRNHADSERCAAVTPAEADAVIAHLVELGR